jgi:hypothetical protein
MRFLKTGVSFCFPPPHLVARTLSTPALVGRASHWSCLDGALLPGGLFSAAVLRRGVALRLSYGDNSSSLQLVTFLFRVWRPLTSFVGRGFRCPTSTSWISTFCAGERFSSYAHFSHTFSAPFLQSFSLRQLELEGLRPSYRRHPAGSFSVSI